MTPTCIGKSPEWWDTGDDGNRLAILLCQQCPTADWCRRRVPNPCGVIVAGVANADLNGGRRPLPQCGCGYPVVRQRPGNPMCTRCDPPPVAMPPIVLREWERLRGLRRRAPKVAA